MTVSGIISVSDFAGKTILREIFINTKLYLRLRKIIYGKLEKAIIL